MSVLFEELRELIKAFNGREIEFALCGGLAVAAHGLVRATEDIDFLIRDAIIIPNIDQLSASAISSLKLLALLCFSLCAGAGSFIALRRR